MNIDVIRLFLGFYGFVMAVGSLLWWLVDGTAFWGIAAVGILLATWGRPEARKLEQALR